MSNVIILGAGFGDEGKGMFTDHICEHTFKPIVIRFSGGHQAGHTVVRNGIRHIFSSFGSGTLQGVPTYWSRYCTFYPIAFMNEHKDLVEKGISPVFYIDPLSPVVTPMDINWNQTWQEYEKNGTVGVGVGATWERQEEFYKLHAMDLFYNRILEEKFNNIENYYDKRLAEEREVFFEAVEYCKKYIKIRDANILKSFPNRVFEGSQGIMLDQDFGFFPNVTRGNTTSKNAFKILREIGSNLHKEDIYYITRCYTTRHGNGPMIVLEEEPEWLKENKLETNITSKYQGKFRKGKLDLDALKYAIECDSCFNQSLNPCRNLVVTCVDQIKENLFSNSDVIFNLNLVLKGIVNNIYISKSDDASEVTIVP